ncbi:MAG: hypothetical protein AAF902_12785 [Chloroflexota bacterium]
MFGEWFLRCRLSSADYKLMYKLSQGWTLKSHRNIDGEKRYALYNLEGDESAVAYAQVQKLLKLKLISTNQKFPAATFLLTNLGQKLTKNKNLSGIGSVVHFDS